MPRGPEEQDDLLAGRRGAGEVRDGHGCGGAAEETGCNLWWWRGIFWSSESSRVSQSIFKLACFDSSLTSSLDTGIDLQ